MKGQRKKEHLHANWIENQPSGRACKLSLTFIPKDIAPGITSLVKSFAFGKCSLRSCTILSLLTRYIPILEWLLYAPSLHLLELSTWNSELNFLKETPENRQTKNLSKAELGTKLTETELFDPLSDFNLNSRTWFSGFTFRKPKPRFWFLRALNATIVMSALLFRWASMIFW